MFPSCFVLSSLLVSASSVPLKQPSSPSDNEELWRSLLPSADAAANVLQDDGAAIFNGEDLVVSDDDLRFIMERAEAMREMEEEEVPRNEYLGREGAKYPELTAKQREFGVNPSYDSFYQPELKEEEMRDLRGE